jgi:hypothetical protein
MACPLLWETKKVEILNGKIFIEKGHPMVRANVVQNDAMFWKRDPPSPSASSGSTVIRALKP